MRLLSWLIQRNLEPLLPSYQTVGLKCASWGAAHNKCWHLISILITFQAALFEKSLTYTCLVIALSQAGNEAAR